MGRKWARATRTASTVWLCAWLAFLVGCAARRDEPRAEHGTLDLTHWNMSEAPTMNVVGPWDFWWQKELAPNQLAAQAPSGSIESGDWARQTLAGEALPKHGYGTYRLRIKLPKDTRLVALKFDAIYSASRIYVDGKLTFENGRPGTSGATSHILHRPRLFDYAPMNDQLELVVNASNFEYTFPGVMGLTIGQPAELHRARETSLAQSVVLLGGMLLMLLYHVGLYALRPGDKSPLDFAVMCGATGLFNLVTAGELVWYVVPGLDGEGWWKLYFLGWFGGVLGYQLFLQSVLPDEFDARLRRYMVGFTAFCALGVLALPFYVFHVPIARLYQLYSLVGVSHAVWVLYRGVTHKREGASVLMAGTSGMFALFLHDILVAEHFIEGQYLTPLGLFFVLFAESILLAARFSKAFSMVEASERARTQFFHNTSHELRTPLNGILGFVDLLRRGHYGALGSGARAALDKVAHLTESLRGQVNTILDLAKSKQGKLGLACTRVSLNDVIHELMALADGLSLRSSELSFDCDLSWDLDRDSPSFVTDQEKLLAILRNLLGNAFKFREANRPHRVTLRMRLRSGELEAEVEDTGIGIPKNQQSRIFEEFVQVEGHASRAYEGTGLGLAMVKSCVKILHGTLTLDSEPGRGTRIRVRLPELALGVVSEPEPAPSVPSKLVVSALHPLVPVESGVVSIAQPQQLDQEILVVDDNATNLEVMRELLRSAGYPVVTCAGGREALVRLRDQPPDLLLLDLMMPEVSGEDVLSAMRRDASLAGIPVILLTARASQEDRLMGLRLGADDYLAKPVDSGELLLRVKNTLARSNLAREKVQRDQNLEAARAVQQALLPAHRNYPGFVLEDYYQAAEQTGGDWYGYAYDEKRSRFYVAIGDVTGHGVPAALVTGAAAGAFKAAFALLRETDRAHGDVLRSLASAVNEAVRDTGHSTGRMMTMTFLCLDGRTGMGYYLNAGHQPFYVVGREGSRSLLQKGSALGSEGTLEFGIETFQLRSGDSVFLYTDGLTENPSADGKTLSPRRLQKVLDGLGPKRDLKPALLGVLNELWRDQTPPDDCSFVVVRWQPDKTAARRGATA